MKSGYDWPSGSSSFREEILKFFPVCVYVKQVAPGAEPFFTPGLQFEQSW